MNKYLIIATASIILLLYLYIAAITDKKNAEILYNQNVIAFNDSLKLVKINGDSYYHKYVELQDVNAIKDEMINKHIADLVKRDEKILTLTKQNLALIDIISSGESEPDSNTGIPEHLLGKVLKFKQNLDFYNYEISVTLGNPSFHNFYQSFYPDIGMYQYLTRNNKGEWSGYTKFEPDFVNKYLKITNARYIVEKDEYLQIETDKDKFRFNFISAIGLLITDDVKLMIGASVKLNNHILEYRKGINNSFHYAGYGYSF